MSERRCPALFITAPASGQGKTTVTAALARLYRDRGLRVRVFKTGPDFLDPMILQRASGHPVYQLDLWMGGEAHCRQLLYEAAGSADLILIEGVMGLFDGNPCSADLAALFGIPVLAVIDGSAMAQTFGAIVHGLQHYRPGLAFAGVLANRVAGEGHYRMLRESLPGGVTAYGWLAREAEIALPERHLGLLQADEIGDLDARIARSAQALKQVTHDLPQPVRFTATQTEALPPLLAGVRIALADDAAFTFLYRANLELLQALGARLLPFSPLADHTLPAADALYLPGGYPELHLDRLAANHAMKQAISAHHAAGRPLLAECGGMLYLLESLTDLQGHCADLVGLLPGRSVMQSRLANLGLQRAALPEGELRGHTFHHSRMTEPPEASGYAESARHQGRGEAIYRQGRLLASYLHWYFPSNPVAAARLFLP
ncbi:cobyrinate a,c-diamide synthase [Sedimenticola sp.]|uniref:cobyrinate a,c-diamide synthase n=1 Tax=Sedimenticola sp. TaxID=1940285 RepID=UPI003D13B37A